MILKHFPLILFWLVASLPSATAQMINQVNPLSVGMNDVFPSYHDSSWDWKYALRFQNLFGLSELSSFYGSVHVPIGNAFYTLHTGFDQSSLHRPFHILLSGNSKVEDHITLGTSVQFNAGNNPSKPQFQLGFSSNYQRSKQLCIGQHFSLNILRSNPIEPASVLRFFVQWQSGEQLRYFIAAQIKSRGWMGLGSLTLKSEKNSWTLGLMVDQNPQAYFGTQWNLGFGRLITALYYHKQLHFSPIGEFAWLAD
jgi:hypothetical protein